MRWCGYNRGTGPPPAVICGLGGAEYAARVKPALVAPAMTDDQADLDREQDLFSQALAGASAAVDGFAVTNAPTAVEKEPQVPAPRSLTPMPSGLSSPDRSLPSGGGSFDARPSGQTSPGKAGWRGLFGGGRRPEMTAIGPEPEPQQGLKPMTQSQVMPEDTIEPQTHEDLEIPSFLRRLAN